MRERRKHEHIEAVKSLPDTGGSGFSDVTLLPASAPEVNLDAVDFGISFLGHHLRSPILINAMTGGTPEAARINRRLARFAARHGLAMAVGSETAGLNSGEAAQSYSVVREANPDGLLIANLGMGADVDRARRAVDLIRANALQIHWNAAQELFMAEGDRRFSGMLAQLARLAEALDVPILAKEVGQGMTGPAARRFVRSGAKAVDIGGKGGTNFIAVEAWRRGIDLDDEWRGWGIPTAASLAETVAEVGALVPIVASGGIRTGHDVAKALAMGAGAVGVAGPLMRLATADDPDARLEEWLARIHWTLSTVMVLTGSATIADLRGVPTLIGASTLDWLRLRGYEDYCVQLARRSRT